MAQSAAVLWRAIEEFPVPATSPFQDRLITADTPWGISRFSFYLRNELVYLRFWVNTRNGPRLTCRHSPFDGLLRSIRRATGFPPDIQIIEDEGSNGHDDMFTLVYFVDPVPALLRRDAEISSARLGADPKIPALRQMSNHEILQARRLSGALQSSVDRTSVHMNFPAPRVYDPFEAIPT